MDKSYCETFNVYAAFDKIAKKGPASEFPSNHMSHKETPSFMNYQKQ